MVEKGFSRVIHDAFALNDRKSGFFGLDYLPNDGVGWKLVFGANSVTSFLNLNNSLPL